MRRRQVLLGRGCRELPGHTSAGRCWWTETEGGFPEGLSRKDGWNISHGLEEHPDTPGHGTELRGNAEGQALVPRGKNLSKCSSAWGRRGNLSPLPFRFHLVSPSPVPSGKKGLQGEKGFKLKGKIPFLLLSVFKLGMILLQLKF